MQPRRVAVVGLGVVSPNGIGVATAWPNLLAGQSGIKEITSFDTTDFAVKIAGEIRNWDSSLCGEKDARRLDRCAQFSLVASDEACRQARIGREFPDSIHGERVGVLVSSGIGGILSLEEQNQVFATKGPRRVSALLIPRLIINLIPGNISIRHGFKGPSLAIVSACATGAHSIGEGFRMIRWGYADAVVAGGAEAAITPVTVAGFQNMKALSTRNELVSGASSPFDRDRDGFVIAEGAACVVLEEWSSAVRRGAQVLAEIVGYGSTSDAHHITAPPEGAEGMVRSMRAALSEAGIGPDELGYINAHGTSTPYNDKHETAGIKAVLGDRARAVPISSTKSMVGHLLGGAGAIGAIACIKTLEEGKIHPTTNLRNPDPECDLDYVPNEGRTATVHYAIANSMGFGGQNASLVFKKSGS